MKGPFCRCARSSGTFIRRPGTPSAMITVFGRIRPFSGWILPLTVINGLSTTWNWAFPLT